MFPFNLSGPSFLLFYAVFVAACMVFFRRQMRSEEDGARPRLGFDDPYRIAYLRAGPHEALRVAVVSLHDRGLLRVDGENLVVTQQLSAELGRRRIEQLVLRKCAQPVPSDEVVDESARLQVDAEYGPALEQERLLPDEAQRAARRARTFWLLGAVLGIAALRLAQALFAGRSNVWFLVIMAVMSGFLAIKLMRPRRTALGDRVIDELKVLFASLKRRAASIRAGGATTEAAMLAAVFGVAALSGSQFAWISKLFPKTSSGSSSSGSCGASCGSSSSCGGGGGCGGGGD